MTLDELLTEMETRAASDLHLLDGVVPKIRIHGRLEQLRDELPDVQDLVEPILSDRHVEIFNERGEVDLAHEMASGTRFRANVFLHEGGVGAVFRRIPSVIPSLEELAIPAEASRFTEFGQGIVLVTGPTGSGKSSTLAALLDQVNRDHERHVVTIEDPIEFVHTDRSSTFTQREIGEDATDFAAALQSASRQDADLVLVGEMRDRETISLALTLAEMGMLVFSTVHTNSAGRTVDRIVEVFAEDEQPRVRTMLAQSLRGVLSQILCRRKDDSGRVPATELLFGSTAVSAVIREGDTHKIPSILQSGRAQGMHRMDDSLYQLVKDDVITAEEAYGKADDKTRFDRFLNPGAFL